MRFAQLHHIAQNAKAVRPLFDHIAYDKQNVVL